MKEIDEGKNMLPTFHKTFKEYVKELGEVFYSISKNIENYKNIISSRDNRRGKWKVKKNTKGKIKNYKKPMTKTKFDRKIKDNQMIIKDISKLTGIPFILFHF